MTTSKRGRRERGAAAVEMAIVLPLLLFIIAGMIDLGRLFYVQTMVTNAAREGARMASLGYDTSAGGAADLRVFAASPGLVKVAGAPTVGYVACPASPGPAYAASSTVAAANFEWLVLGGLVGFFGPTLAAPDPTSTATMRCLG